MSVRLILILIVVVFGKQFCFSHNSIQYYDYRNKISLTNPKGIIPDSDEFIFDDLDSTLGEKFTENDCSKLKNISKVQALAWLPENFFKQNGIENFNTNGSYIKLISFQRKRPKYYAILLGYANANDLEEQYLITIGKNGGYVDYIKVGYGENLSNSDAEYDSISGGYSYIRFYHSGFKGDSIFLYKAMSLGDKPVSHNSKNKWDELHEFIYVIKSDGKIVCVRKEFKVR